MQSLLRFCLFFVLLISCFVARSQPWTRITTLPIKSYYALETIGSTMYAGTIDTMFYSKDKGATWIMRKLPTTGFRVTCFTSYNGRLFVGTDDGVFMSGDEGVSWAKSNIGIGINQFAKWNGDLYAATQGAGVFICSQVSNTWTPFNVNLPNGFPAGDMVRILNDGTTLVTTAFNTGAWYKYNVSSLKWNEHFYNGSGADPTMIVYDLVNEGPNMMVQTNNGWLLRSDDSGLSWQQDAVDMRGGNNGVLMKGYYKNYAIWNTSGGAWIQSRNRSDAALTSWATGEEFFTNGQVRAAREFDRKMILATDNGVYWKANGSPSVGIGAASLMPAVEIFPNPVSQSSATIRGEGLSRIQVYDVMGRIVQDHSVNAAQFPLHIAEPGIYSLKILVQGKWISRRLQVL